MKQKGNCFQAHVDFLLKETHLDEKDVRLCHGMVSLNGGVNKGKRTAHAWIEFMDGQMVLDCSGTHKETIILHRKYYYRLGRIKSASVVRYTISEMKANLLKLGHYGVWTKFDDDEVHGSDCHG